MSSQEDELRKVITARSDDLRRILRHYVLKAGLGEGGNTDAIAVDLLNDVVVEALRHAERLPQQDNAMPWLLGIGVNLIKRRQAERVRLNQREPLLRDLYPTETLSDDDLIDQFAAAAEAPEQQLERQGFWERLFSHTSADDQRILRLAVLNGMDGDALGAELGISAGAARVRLHRALKRLRQIWGTREKAEHYE